MKRVNYQATMNPQLLTSTETGQGTHAASEATAIYKQSIKLRDCSQRGCYDAPTMKCGPMIVNGQFGGIFHNHLHDL
jgi:hypothetical protein